VKSDLGTQTAAYASIRSKDPGETGALHKDNGKGGEHLSFAVEEQAAVLPESVLEDGSAEDSGIYQASRGYNYQISKAVSYADRYWKHYNHSYHNYANEGGDCANFVSQCLYAGGMPRTDDWFPQSVNWINVMGHIRHFKAYGSFLTASDSNVSAGNPVYFDWNRDGIYDHTTICVGVNSSGMPVVDSHTANLYHAPWKLGDHAKRGTIRLHGTGAPSRSTPKKNSWETVGGKTYYIGSDGKRVKNRFLTINGARYYFNSSGVRVTGFFKVGSYWHYASVKTGKMLTGFQWIGGNTYYFSVKNYARLTGRQWIAGNTYYFNGKGIRQYGFLKIGGKYYYAAPKTGRFVKGWKQINGKWYFFDRKTMVRAAGWKVIDGRRCYFDSSGVLRKGRHG
jgi:glucan-binding YG repeat protein